MNKRKKILIFSIIAAVVIGGGIGTYVGLGAYKESKTQSEDESSEDPTEQAQKEAENSYNDKISSVSTGDVTTSIDLSGMKQSVNDLNAIAEDVNNDDKLTDEQKQSINASISSQLDSLNSRIATVSKDKAEESKAAAQEKIASQAKANEQRSSQAAANKQRDAQNQANKQRESQNQANKQREAQNSQANSAR